jgi:hypothetical protein
VSLRPSAISSWGAVWVVDFEFCHDPNGRPSPICLAAHDLVSGQRLALWRDEMGHSPPYDIGENAVFVCYSGQEAELACHLALGWALPVNVVDLIVVYRMAINGRGGCQNVGLLEALARYNIPTTATPAEKKRAQLRAAQGWPFTTAEREWLLDYCRGDVHDECALLQTLGAMALSPVALWHGKALIALAMAWWRGVPIDPAYVPVTTDPVHRLALRHQIITDINRDFPIYDESDTRKADKFESWLITHGIPVPRTPTGRVSFALETIERLARDYPALAPYAETKRTLDQLRDYTLPIGADNRLRAWFAPFLTKTSRAAPATNSYIYSLPAWMRATMLPATNTALGYVDYKAMEFGLAAAVTGDRTMAAFYRSGDPYLATAIAAGAVPPGATKDSHPAQRELYKTGVLACLYGIGPVSLAQRLQQPVSFARRFLDTHHALFAEYWRQSDGMVAEAIRSGGYTSRHGWHYAVCPPFNVRSLRNWVIQTTGADVLRCALIFADVIGLEILATAHDAVLFQAPQHQYESRAAELIYCMKLASAVLCDGFALDVDQETKSRGERFLDKRGKGTFAIVEKFVTKR